MNSILAPVASQESLSTFGLPSGHFRGFLPAESSYRPAQQVNGCFGATWLVCSELLYVLNVFQKSPNPARKGTALIPFIILQPTRYSLWHFEDCPVVVPQFQS